ncbi:hypothetical protein [Xanthomonas campestris]|uniref:hypothetical protein n=1 Tax=Xanthomonas campestris TaxID=339 RepID=UPI002B22D3FA|nr:hypothetical protein [Xanthomonas campestris]MEA9657811.1 hypothetical protein [Xanthomonas campestris pv. raphani]
MIQHLVNVSGGKDRTATYLKAIEPGPPFRAVLAVQHDRAGTGPDIAFKDEPASVAKHLRCAHRQPRDRVYEIELAAMGVAA